MSSPLLTQSLVAGHDEVVLGTKARWTVAWLERQVGLRTINGAAESY